MKNILLIFAVLLMVSCNKDEANEDGFVALSRELSFRIDDAIEDDDLKMSGELRMVDGELTHNFEDGLPWIGMGKLETSEISGFPTYGVYCYNCTTPGYLPIEYAKSNIFYETNLDQYVFLKYLEQPIDTLKIRREVTLEPYSSTYTFYINGEVKEKLEFQDPADNNFTHYYINLENIKE